MNILCPKEQISALPQSSAQPDRPKKKPSFGTWFFTGLGLLASVYAAGSLGTEVAKKRLVSDAQNYPALVENLPYFLRYCNVGDPVDDALLDLVAANAQQKITQGVLVMKELPTDNFPSTVVPNPDGTDTLLVPTLSKEKPLTADLVGNFWRVLTVYSAGKNSNGFLPDNVAARSSYIGYLMTMCAQDQRYPIDKVERERVKNTVGYDPYTVIPRLNEQGIGSDSNLVNMLWTTGELHAYTQEIGFREEVVRLSHGNISRGSQTTELDSQRQSLLKRVEEIWEKLDIADTSVLSTMPPGSFTPSYSQIVYDVVNRLYRQKK